MCAPSLRSHLNRPHSYSSPSSRFCAPLRFILQTATSWRQPSLRDRQSERQGEGTALRNRGQRRQIHHLRLATSRCPAAIRPRRYRRRTPLSAEQTSLRARNRVRPGCARALTPIADAKTRDLDSKQMSDGHVSSISLATDVIPFLSGQQVLLAASRH